MSLAEAHAPRGFVAAKELYRALAEIDRLKDDIAHLREMVGADVAADTVTMLRQAFRLSRAQAMILLLIESTKVRATPALIAQAELGSDEVLRTQVFHLRKRLARCGAPMAGIIAHWGVGYSMSAELRAWLHERVPSVFKGGSHEPDTRTR